MELSKILGFFGTGTQALSPSEDAIRIANAVRDLEVILTLGSRSCQEEKIFPLFGGRRVEHLVEQGYLKYLCSYDTCEKGVKSPCVEFGNPKNPYDPPLGVVTLTEAGKELYKDIAAFLDKGTIKAVGKYFEDMP